MPRDRACRIWPIRCWADDPSGIDAWAQRLNMSSRTLMRRFRQETGVTLGQWRQRAAAAGAGNAVPGRLGDRAGAVSGYEAPAPSSAVSALPSA